MSILDTSQPPGQRPFGIITSAELDAMPHVTPAPLAEQIAPTWEAMTAADLGPRRVTIATGQVFGGISRIFCTSDSTGFRFHVEIVGDGEIMLVSVRPRGLLSYERFQYIALRDRGALFYSPQLSDAQNWMAEIARHMASSRLYREDEHHDVLTLDGGRW